MPMPEGLDRACAGGDSSVRSITVADDRLIVYDDEERTSWKWVTVLVARKAQSRLRTRGLLRPADVIVTKPALTELGVRMASAVRCRAEIPEYGSVACERVANDKSGV